MNVTRRSFIQTTSIATAALTASPWLSQAQPAPVRVRQSVNKLSNTDQIIKCYRKAVEVMSARPASDPTSWEAQAQIHQNFCPHDNWFFLPWHRAYLQWFEDICRKACGDETFALPYWDWTNYSTVPPHFWGTNNPLMHTRDIGQQESIPGEFVGKTAVDGVLATKDFEAFASTRATTQRDRVAGGQLEGTPHNNVHGYVGGDMSSFMSPRDPIFWLHHANVDRLWTEWISLGNSNTNDTGWLNFAFPNNFVNRAKQKQSPKVKDLLSTYALGYRYDTQPATPPVAGSVAAAFQPRNDMFLAAMSTAEITPRKPFALAIASTPRFDDSIASLMDVNPSRAIRLRIQDMEVPADPGVSVRVFINCTYLSETTPLNSPSYVGTLGFFALDHVHEAGAAHDHGGAVKPAFVFDITRTLLSLRRTAGWKPEDKITVQLLAMPRRGGTGQSLKVNKFRIEEVGRLG